MFCSLEAVEMLSLSIEVKNLIIFSCKQYFIKMLFVLIIITAVFEH